MTIRKSGVDCDVYIVVSLCAYDCEYEVDAASRFFVFGCFWEHLKLISGDIIEMLFDHHRPIS